jgi:hypothetical protein
MASFTVGDLHEAARYYGALLDGRKIVAVFHDSDRPTVVSGTVQSVEELKGIVLRLWTVTIRECT